MSKGFCPVDKGGWTPEALLRPEFLSLQPYQAKVFPGTIRLDANENPFPWPQAMRDALAEIPRTPMNRYPDSAATAIREAIAAYVGRRPEEILVGNGSDETIQMLLLAFTGTGTKTVISSPTFVMYQMATAYAGAAVIDVPLKKEGKNFSLDVEGILKAANRPETRVVFICNPNNPTGNCFPEEDILRIITGTDRIVVLDEAYGEFSGRTLTPRLPEFPNLVIMRTFSKAFAMAGLRVGYLVANEPLLTCIHKVRQPFNLNTFSQQAAAKALEFLPEFRQQINVLKAERNRLYVEMGKLPVTVYPSDANYLFFETGQDSREVWQGLLDRKVVVRNLGIGLRVTVGTPEENEQFLAALRSVVGA